MTNCSPGLGRGCRSGGRANQSLAAEYLVKHSKELAAQVYPVPEPLDRQIARLKLESMGIQVDKLSPEQEHYLASWSEGT